MQKGRHLADIICANCHVVARDQRFEPILRPPVPSFELIAQHGIVDESFLRSFLMTTHRDVRNPEGMPNPMQMDYQIPEIAAYFISLQNASANQTTRPSQDQSECMREITRLENSLGEARGNRVHAPLGTTPESTQPGCIGSRLQAR